MNLVQVDLIIIVHIKVSSSWGGVVMLIARGSLGYNILSGEKTSNLHLWDTDSAHLGHLGKIQTYSSQFGDIKKSGRVDSPVS